MLLLAGAEVLHSGCTKESLGKLKTTPKAHGHPGNLDQNQGRGPPGGATGKDSWWKRYPAGISRGSRGVV